MDEKEFKKHLRDLVHGHHNPAEHDWGGGIRRVEPAKRTKNVKQTARKKRA
jgi:hypothetical protein